MTRPCLNAPLHQNWNLLTLAAVLAVAGATSVAAEPEWLLVEAYVELDEAWHAKDMEIRNADVSGEEKERLRKEEPGAHPDMVLAVSAARAIIESDGRRAADVEA